MKKLLFILLFAAGFLIFPQPMHAAGNFKTYANVVYAVNESGSTHATFTITLSNITSQYYASSYNMMFGFKTIENLRAVDSGGLMRTEVKKKDNGHEVELTLNNRVIGFGKKNVFTISFDTPDIARAMGTVKEINIPGLANQQEFEDFHVHVDVPRIWGKPSYAKPDVLSNTLDFTKEQLAQSGVSIGFGEGQIYQFTLTYHLSNKNIFPVRTEIALPPTTNYQEVLLQDITPKPANVTQDQDGNWLAQYILMPSQKIDVLVKGNAVLSMKPKETFLTDAEKKLYLQEKPYWQVNDPQIQELAKELKTPQAIYQYIVNSLTYDFSRVTNDQERVGAMGVLRNPKSAVCLEFTDLFITLARAAGIPAREVDGFAYTENTRERPLSLVKDILHAWPEYYDEKKQQWIMVDPTWQNTTKGIDYFTSLDFDHFAFTIKGLRSDYPIAAGGYKIPGQEDKKDIDITFSDTVPEKKMTLESAIALQTGLFTNAVDGTILLKNKGNSLIPTQKVIVTGSDLQPEQQTVYTPAIPPFGQTTIPVTFTKPAVLTKEDVDITIQLGNIRQTKSVHIASLFSAKTLIIGGIIIGSISITLFIIAKGTRYLLLRRRSR